MGAQMRGFDWSRTPLGDAASWPQSLKTVVRIVLDSRYAMWMCWGPELTFFCNDAYLPTLGLKRSWALGSPASKVWEEIWPDIGPRIEHVLAGGGATWDEGLLLFLERSGYSEETYHTFSYSPIHDDSGKISGMLCVVTEATEQFIGERRLATLRAAASTLAETLTEPSMLAALAACLRQGARDLPFTLTYLVNSHGALELAQQTGFEAVQPGEWPLDAAMARHDPLLVDDLDRRFPELPTGPWDRRATQALIVPIGQQGQSGHAGLFVAGLNPYRPLDAGYRDFLNLLVGQIASGLASARAHAATKARAEALAELDRAKTAFFSNVSHEFRTPLTLMMGPIEEALADRSHPLGSLQRKHLETAHRNSVRLLKLVNTMLDFSRIEAGRAQASFAPVQFEQFTADLVSVFRSVIERAGMELDIDVRPLPGPVYIDRDLWEKVVLNLMSNAFKYTLAGRITVMIYPAEDSAKFVVADTGTGIPASALPRLFERFYRVPDARGRTHEGTGIGLALVHELVKLHGGTIAVESEVGLGSRFTVTLPFGKSHLSPQDVEAERNGRAPSPGSVSYVSEALRWLPDGADHSLTSSTGIFRPRLRASASGKVLLADDNADMRDYVRRILEEAGYDVIAAADGAAALALARSEQPELVLSDVMMPNLDGFALLATLRSEPQTREMPVILLSARAGEEAKLEGLQQGADDYLTKPFSTRELIARVGSTLASSRSRKAIAGALRDEARTLETLNRVGKVVAAELDLDRVVQFVTDAATELTGATVGCFFHDIGKDEQGVWLYSVSSNSRGEFERLPARRKSELFRLSLEGSGIVRLDDITTDSRFEGAPPYLGMASQLPVRSYLSVPVVSRSGTVIGGLSFGHSQVGVFTERSERFAAGIASQAAIAIDNARLYQSAQQELAERERAQHALREADRRKDEFLALLSHELRNPLAPIRNGLQIMRLSGFQHPMQLKAYEVLDRQVSHLVRLVDDLMDVSRITRGKLELRKSRIRLSSVIDAALETVRSVIEEARHKLTVREPPDAIELDADAVRLTQVMANLLSNAAKYTAPGGWINVDVAAPSAESIEIRVSDNGIGIAPESIDNVFEMFTQFDRVQSRSPGGLGIGLSLVKGLIEMHGGTVQARSAGVGQGSTFIVRLPRHASGELTPREAVSAPAHQPRRRVLVVDDNVDSADSMASLLRMMGHEARIAHDGAQAIDAARSFVPDVIIMDIGMPNMDGLEATRRIRKLSLEKRPTIVALTGWGQERDRRNSVAAGVDRHLVKPVDADTIAQVLQA